MQVILTKEVRNVGRTGEVKTVSDSFARDYLIPRGYAIEATDSAIKQHPERIRRDREKLLRIKNELQVWADSLAEKRLVIAGKTSSSGRLYGALTAQEIASEAKRQFGIDLDKRMVTLTEPIKSLGLHELVLQVHPEIVAKLSVEVVDGPANNRRH